LRRSREGDYEHCAGLHSVYRDVVADDSHGLVGPPAKLPDQTGRTMHSSRKVLGPKPPLVFLGDVVTVNGSEPQVEHKPHAPHSHESAARAARILELMPAADAMAQDRAPSDRGVAGGATINALAQVSAAVAGALMGVVVARLLGPDGTGSFNVILAAVLVGYAFSSLGLPTGLTYYVGNRTLAPGDAMRYAVIGSALVGTAGAAIGLLVAIAGGSGPLQRIPLGTFALGLAALPFFIAWMTASGVAIAIERYGIAAAVAAGQASIALFGALVLTPWLDLAGAVAAVTASHVAVAALVFAWSVRRLPASRAWVRNAPAALRAANAFGWKVYVTQALTIICQRADLFVLNAYVAAASVGHYAIAVAATLTGTLVPRSLATVVFPRIAKLGALSPTARLPTIVKSVRHVSLIAIATAFVMAPALLLIPLVYGDDFSPAVDLGLILVPGVAALAVQGVLASILVGLGRPDYLLRVGLIVTPPTFVAYIALIPALGPEGAALASTLSYFASALLTYRYLRRAVALPPLRALAPTRDELNDYRVLLQSVRSRD
jgi:O-antigen/teichoic acid export membrane protein